MNRKFTYIALIVALTLVSVFFFLYKQKQYMSKTKDSDECKSMYFVCLPGKKQFSDTVGCGCE